MKDLEAYFYTFLCKPILGQDTLYSGQCKQIIYHYKCNELITILPLCENCLLKFLIYASSFPLYKSEMGKIKS